MNQETKEIHIKIGEVKTGHVGELLKATLGSCVGIAFFWPEKQLSGLAHCLLSQAPNHTTQIGAKYVSQAIPSLMALMKIKTEDIPFIQVYVVGGGNMLHQLGKKQTAHIGIQNSQTAQSLLETLGFKIKKMDTGGNYGRQIFLDCSSGEVIIKQLTK